MRSSKKPFPGFILTAAMLAFAGACSAGAAVITTSISSRKLSVGDPIRFTVNILAAHGATVFPPAPEADFGRITVREWNMHKTEREKSDSLSYEYIVTTYTPEPCTIPELTFRLEYNGETDTLRTEALPLQIVSVLPSDTVDLMGLKPPFQAGKAPRWWLWLSIAAAVAAGLVPGIIWLNRRLRKAPPPPPPVPPYEEAIDALRNLAVKKYLQRGLYREYVFELSEIFKRYIGRRFSCNAVDFTTEEMIAWTAAAALPKNLSSAIEWFFRTTDPVKFARFVPEAQILDSLERQVRDFLEATKPKEESEMENGAAAEAQGKATFTTQTASTKGGGK